MISLSPSDIVERLSSKLTFEAAVSDLESLLCGAAHDQIHSEWSKSSVDAVLKKVLRLLRSRYTSKTFWWAALDLFQACRAKFVDTSFRAFLDGAIAECQDATKDSAREPLQRLTLFEGQFSNPADFAQPVEARIDTEIAAALASMPNFLTDVPQQKKAPPASKWEVKNLKRVKLEEVTPPLEGDQTAICSICREDLRVGDEVQIMPCIGRHTFHPECLKSWLEANNSCPICRHELPTDDWRYEARKERDKEDAEARLGSENAQTHNDFLFI